MNEFIKILKKLYNDKRNQSNPPKYLKKIKRILEIEEELFKQDNE